jgi:A/G-specific adenine glycosylase
VEVGGRRRAEALLAWYAGAARDLPWRRTRDPYALLVSEVMLQQTQAARVVPRYERFLARFPDAAALAAAPVRDVLEEWSGLGYNRRALALHAAARELAAHGWPADLATLPGVGGYTAAAVASFAWDAQRAAVDVNVRRVIERWDGRPRTARELSARAEELLPAGRAAQWNQAMMELGARVCGARRADCAACPVSAWCASAVVAVAGRPATVKAVPSAGAVSGRATVSAAPSVGAASGRATVSAVASAGAASGRATVKAVPSASAAGGPARPRFEDTDRWARGRVVAALLADAPLPALEPARRTRVLAGLVRDGLVVTAADGSVRLP